MTLARIVGTVVCSESASGITGASWRLAEPCNHRGQPLGNPIVALDMVSAADGDVVLLCKGSSVRWTRRTAEKPVDAMVAAVVDIIDEGGELTYRAHGERNG
jgi:microcompartment protein CcmK/EutM